MAAASSSLPLSSKKLINDAEHCVDDSLSGFVASHPGLRQVRGHRIVIREDFTEYKRGGKVSVVTGGGSGHEPVFAGYVGHGALTAAVPGSVFASPPPPPILAALRLITGPAGTLVIVANYTGDRLNFGIAAERARMEGVKLRVLVVGEDCALSSIDKTAGRRGLCGITLCVKIAGALAEQGKSLDEIHELVMGRVLPPHMGTIGVCLSPCSRPGAAHSMFALGHEDMELGLGVHGEAGVRRMKLGSARQVVRIMIDHMTDEKSVTHLSLSAGERVVMMLNNLGSTTNLEMGIVCKEALDYLTGTLGVAVDRVYSGLFMTSLEMSGVQICLLKLGGDASSASVILDALDAATTAPGWPYTSSIEGTQRVTPALVDPVPVPSHEDVRDAGDDAETVSGAASLFEQCVVAACNSLLDKEEYLNDLDSGCGDGDTGSTMRRGAQAILAHVSAGRVPLHAHLLHLASAAEEQMGGVSGGIYSLLFTSAAQHLAATTGGEVHFGTWVGALSAVIGKVSEYGGAEVGDRTMLDALSAALHVMRDYKGDVRDMAPVSAVVSAAADAARQMAQTTANMPAKAGRASYVSADLITKPDPGAMVVAIWFTAIADTVKRNVA